MRYRLLSIALLSLSLALGISGRVRARDDTPSPDTVAGRVFGQVVNLSSDGNQLDGVPVVLYGLEDFALRETYTTTISVDGTFSFESVGLVSGYSYIATLEYENVDYGSTFIEYDGLSRSPTARYRGLRGSDKPGADSGQPSSRALSILPRAGCAFRSSISLKSQ